MLVHLAAHLAVSSDGESLALIDCDRLGVSFVPLIARDAKNVHRFSASVLVPLPGKKGSSAPQQLVPERFVALAWSGDGDRLLVAGAGGALYLLDRCAWVVHMPAVTMQPVSLHMHTELQTPTQHACAHMRSISSICSQGHTTCACHVVRGGLSARATRLDACACRRGSLLWLRTAEEGPLPWGYQPGRITLTFVTKHREACSYSTVPCFTPSHERLVRIQHASQRLPCMDVCP